MAAQDPALPAMATLAIALLEQALWAKVVVARAPEIL